MESSDEIPQTRYARVDGLRIAYQRFGVGSVRTIIIPGLVSSGVAVNLAARIETAAGAGEILVSSTMRDMLLGSSHALEDRGPHELKGIDGTWTLFALA